MKIKLYSKAGIERRKVSGSFGDFEVSIRRPKATEQVQLRALAIEGNYRDLLPTYLSFVVDWSGIFDQDGEPIPCNERTRDEVFSHREILDAVLNTVSEYCQEPTITEAEEKK